MCVCVCLGGDLHYHLSQHGVFSEKEMRFYAAEIILGLEHMHNRFVVYRDLKVQSAILHLVLQMVPIKIPVGKTGICYFLLLTLL